MTIENVNEHQHPLQHNHEADLAEMLNLDALLVREHLQKMFEWVATFQPAPRTIVDLGAGTGTGTFGLAQTFPDAKIVAVDQSEFMLKHLQEAAIRRSVGDRVSTIRTNLDSAWPALADVDLVWAASSMHHMSDPSGAMGEIRNMLAPHGHLVVVEMETLPRYLPDDLGFGRPGLEERAHQAAARAAWNSHPDWTTDLQMAGLQVVNKRSFAYQNSSNQELIAQSAQMFLSRLREGLGEALVEEDQSAISQLLDPHHPKALGKRTDLSLRGNRTVWVAKPELQHK